ncbi:MAG: hypothetical protein ACRC2K_09895 [Clostridium sp.]
MYNFYSDELRDRDILDLSNFPKRIIYIGSNIKDITFTTFGKLWEGAIIVKERKEDLVININNVNINSGKHIALDVRGGRTCNYKNTLSFMGKNTIKSEDNLAICISNNQTLHFKGEERGILTILGGLENTAVGNNIYTGGSGHLIFSKYGEVFIKGGNGFCSERRCDNSGKCGGHGIGFINKSFSDISSIKINDNINVKIIGGEGQDASSFSMERCGGKGGAGIYLEENSILEKLGEGLLEVNGGNGGGSTGDNKCSGCGDGGSAIEIKSGWININHPATLIGGNGGNVDTICKHIFSKGGNGGDCIRIINSDIDNYFKATKIRIDDFIVGKGGHGGCSGMEFQSLSGFQGGDGGNLLNSNNFKTVISIGDVDFTGGEGGAGGVNGVNGGKGQNFKGINIMYADFVRPERAKEDKVNNSVSEAKEVKSTAVVKYDEQQAKETKGDNKEKEHVGGIIKRFFNFMAKIMSIEK